MEPSTAHKSNSKAHATVREFKFVDQNDRTREGASAYQTVVRSHVMTEVRRQRRSKAKINAETSRHPPTRLISRGPNLLPARNPPLSNSNEIYENSSSSTEPLAVPLTHSCGVHEFQYSFQFQADQAVNSYSSNTDATIPAEPMINGDLAYAGTAHSDTLAVNEDIQDDVSIYPRHDQIRETIPKPTILGISRIDPFRALPVPPDEDTYQLLNHCKFP